jgi:hypothetical protein
MLAQQGETRERHGELLVEILHRLSTSTSD